MRSPAARAHNSYDDDPRVPLAKPRSTLGYMRSPAARAHNSYDDDPRVPLAKPRSTLGYMRSPAARAHNSYDDDPRVPLAKPRSTLGYMRSPAPRATSLRRLHHSANVSTTRNRTFPLCIRSYASSTRSSGYFSIIGCT